MRSRRKLRKPVRISHHAASVHVLPQKKTPSGRTSRSVSSPFSFAFFSRIRRWATSASRATASPAADLALLPVFGTNSRVSASSGSSSLGSTPATLLRIDSLARASAGSPNCATIRAPSTSAWISSLSNMSGGRS